MIPDQYFGPMTHIFVKIKLISLFFFIRVPYNNGERLQKKKKTKRTGGIEKRERRNTIRTSHKIHATPLAVSRDAAIVGSSAGPLDGRRGGRTDRWGGVSGAAASTDRSLCLRRPEAVRDLCVSALPLFPGGFGLCFGGRGFRGETAAPPPLEPLPRGGAGLEPLRGGVLASPFPDLFGAIVVAPAATGSDPCRLLLPAPAPATAPDLLPRGGRSEEPRRVGPPLLLARRAGLDVDVDFTPLPERDTLATTALDEPTPEDSIAADCRE